MAKKSNQAYKKRIRVTKKGKLVARKPGQSHFNAKMKREKQLDQKRNQKLKMNNRNFRTFMPHNTRRGNR